MEEKLHRGVNAQQRAAVDPRTYLTLPGTDYGPPMFSRAQPGTADPHGPGAADHILIAYPKGRPPM